MRAITHASIALIAVWGAAAAGGATPAQDRVPAPTIVVHLRIGHPRQPLSPFIVGAGLTAGHAAPQAPTAWFFELTDGSKCRPMAGPGREVEGERELYTCKYGSAGEADAVLGDLDASAPVWTIRKVLINKKAEPQTIKSLAIAPVRTVWQ